MRFERLQSGDFAIDGKQIKRSAFLALEPKYSEPIGTVYLKYESDESSYRLIKTKDRQYKIIGVWDDGERYLKRISDFVQLSEEIITEAHQEETSFEQEIAQAKEQATMGYRDLRRLEYPTIEELVVAMWENLIEKKTKSESGITDIQKLRKKIKDKYPMENNDAVNQNETETN